MGAHGVSGRLPVLAGPAGDAGVEQRRVVCHALLLVAIFGPFGGYEERQVVLARVVRRLGGVWPPPGWPVD